MRGETQSIVSFTLCACRLIVLFSENSEIGRCNSFDLNIHINNATSEGTRAHLSAGGAVIDTSRRGFALSGASVTTPSGEIIIRINFENSIYDRI